MPMAATTQIVAALVRPTTAPRACRIVPAPMKPTPVTICAATRVVSVQAGIEPPGPRSMAIERWVYSTDPTQIRMFVRSPAGLPPSSRSSPIAPPSSVARPSCNIKSRRKISIARWNTSLMEESHPFADLHNRSLRERARALGPGAQPLGHTRGVALQRGRALAHRRERRDHVVRELALAVDATPPRGATLVRDLRHDLRRRESLMQRVDVADLGSAWIFPRHARRIGGRRPQLLPDRFGGLEQADRIAEALRHLGFAIEAQHALRPGQQRLWLGEIALAKARIPAARDFAHQLQVLYLVLSDGHQASFIEQNVSRLQHGVSQQPQQHAFLALRLVLELGLALELAERGDGREQPVEFGVLGDMRLYEDDAPVGIEAGSVQADRHVRGEGRKTGGVVRLGNRMQIDHAEQAVVLRLQRDPVLHGTEVVADVQLAGGLDAAENWLGHGPAKCVNTTT